MTYLLDSNAWITFLRKPRSPLVARLQARQPSEIQVCSVVVAELNFGCLNSARPLPNRAKVEALLRPHISLSFDDLAADQFAMLRRHLESQGIPIGPYDMQIAAIALANGCTLVSHHTVEFKRVPGLLLEDWEVP